MEKSANVANIQTFEASLNEFANTLMQAGMIAAVVAVVACALIVGVGTKARTAH